MLSPEAAPLQVVIPQWQRLWPLADLPGSLAQRVYASLKTAILSLHFRPGENLRKPEICAEPSVSRSPVSEALARLAAEHLVDVRSQAGTFVARLSMDEVREGAFLRGALELAATGAKWPRPPRKCRPRLRSGSRAEALATVGY